MVTVATNGRYEEGTGPTMVLVHGAGGTHHSFDQIWPFLPHTPRWAVDLPGRGRAPEEPCNTAAEAAIWLKQQCDEQGLDRVYIVGHSFGGAVAQEYALQFPRHVAGLVLMATGARLRVHPAVLALLKDAAARNEHAPTPAGLWQAHTPQAVMDLAEEASRNIPPNSKLQDWIASDAFDRLADVSTIEAPTLILGGQNDLLTPPKYSQYLADQIPNSTYIRLAQDGHLFPIENPQQTGALIRRFVLGLESS